MLTMLYGMDVGPILQIIVFALSKMIHLGNHSPVTLQNIPISMKIKNVENLRN